MEIERIKALEQYETREQQRVEERRRGARVLEEQISDRIKERVRQVSFGHNCEGGIDRTGKYIWARSGHDGDLEGV